jgi:hypothetical protein
MAQEWHHVLFLHWRADPEALRSLIPAPLDIERRDGSAWVTALPFAMRRLRPRGLPALPWFSSFPQLNLRTYVTLGGRPGVFLLRVALSSRLAATIGRTIFHLPCVRARLTLRKEGESWLFSCRRRPGRLAGECERPLSLSVRYRPEGIPFRPAPGTLEHWFSERFCYYSVGRDGGIDRGEIDHPPWLLQTARVEAVEGSWPELIGTGDDGAPAHAYYSRRQKAFAWRPERCADRC